MAKRRKTVRTRSARSRPSARKAPRRVRKPDDNETMQIVIAIAVIVLIGFGIYFYQVDVKPMNAPAAPPPAAAMAPPPAAPAPPMAPAPAPTK